MLSDATQTRAEHKLITAAEEDVRVLARRVAGSDRDRIEEFHQIGMQVVCERAKTLAHEPYESFIKQIYHRVQGAMLNVRAAESEERRIQTAIARSVEPVTVNVEEGDYFAAEEERTAIRRRSAAAVVAASLLTLVAGHQSSPEAELEAVEQKARVKTALEHAASTLPPDDWSMVQGVFLQGGTYEAVGQRHNLSASATWRRVESSLEVLHRRMCERLRA